MNGKLLLIDFDNTIIKNPYDVDITGNLNLFLSTWQTLKTIPVNQCFINWLRDKQFIIFTNRASDTHNKVKEHLKDLGLFDNVADFLYCEGKKQKIWNDIRDTLKDEALLIDNSIKYKPNLIMSDKICKWDLRYFEKRYLSRV